MKKLLLAALAVLILPAVLLGAEEKKVDEDELFSSPETVIDGSKLEKKNLDEDQNKKKIGVSGEVTSVNSYTAARPGVETPGDTGDQFRPYILGALFADMRLPSDVKGFGNFEALYDASVDKTDFSARELFIDFNIGRAVYFRTGKQLIQWGRCYLWNPTDLVNVEKKPFMTKIGSREGTYGVKAHVPFGTRANLYGFADTHKTDDASEIAGAGKIEFLIGGTEMAFSAWGKEHYSPVYGYDISTRILGIDIVGEASLSRGSNTKKIVEKAGILTAERDGEKWVSRASVDLGHAFDFNNQPNKIQINLEFFFNGDGYRDNLFQDENTYPYDVPVTIKVDDVDVIVPAGTKALYLAGNNLYEANYHSRYYAAFFVTVNRFFTSDFSLKMNVIGNLDQRSFIGNIGLSYADINDFKAGIEVYGFMGKENTEYTFTGNAALVLLTAGIVF